MYTVGTSARGWASTRVWGMTTAPYGTYRTQPVTGATGRHTVHTPPVTGARGIAGQHDKTTFGRIQGKPTRRPTQGSPTDRPAHDSPTRRPAHDTSRRQDCSWWVSSIVPSGIFRTGIRFIQRCLRPLAIHPQTPLILLSKNPKPKP